MSLHSLWNQLQKCWLFRGQYSVKQIPSQVLISHAKTKTKPHFLSPGGSTQRSGGLYLEGSRCWMLGCLLGELEWPREEEGDSKREVLTQSECSFPAPAQPWAHCTYCACLCTPQVHQSHMHNSTSKAKPKQFLQTAKALKQDDPTKISKAVLVVKQCFVFLPGS